MSHTLTHPQQHHHHSFLWYLLFGLGIIAVLMIPLAFLPSLTVSRSTANPVEESQNAYAEYLRGEKMIYSSRFDLYNAITEHHTGEKIIYMTTVNSGDAMAEYHAGEKNDR